MLHRRRLSALLLCTGMLLVLAVSFAFILHESDHVCDGKLCRTCILIAEKIALLNSFALIGAAVRAFFASRPSKRSGCVRYTGTRGTDGTPVGWKVRMNN